MDFKEVCCNIRSCLNSSKSQLSLTQLLRDYNEVLGEPLPFRALGYNTADAFIRAVPNLRISSIRGELFIDVKPDEKTAHIASLVREQRTAKKKKRKPSRGFHRGGAPLPPPRRPTTIPPPRRSAPPPRDRDYYPSYRKTSPPNQSYQRKPSPPRYISYSNNNSNNRNDNYWYERRKDSPPSTSTYQNYRNSAPIEISSDEDNNYNRNEKAKRYEEVRRKYCPVPSQYNFSDSNEYNDDGSDLEDCDEINSKIDELQVTLGNERQVSINKAKFRSYPSNTSNEDDYGYSSMNEINALINEFLPTPGDAASKGKGDMQNKINRARGPAAVLAAGRAMQEPNISSTSKVPLKDLNPSAPHPTHNFIQKYLSKNSTTHGDVIQSCARAPNPKPAGFREPFRNMNRSDSVASNGSRPPPASSPVDKVDPGLPPTFSKMCDSNMFKPSPYVQPDLSSDTSCGKLLEFTARHNLQPPQFKTFAKFCPKSKAASYMCKIKIGSSLSFTSCPFESSLVKEVQEYTAKIARDELEKRYGNIDLTDLPVTNDENLIIQRIAEIVNPHSSGLKSETIETKYKNVHKQILPLDWLDIVKNRSLLSVEELVGGSIAVYPVEGGMATHLDVSRLPPLVLPENEVWNVYVTCCDSTSSVYFRIVHDEYNGLYVVMDEKMHELYDAKKDSEELQHVEMVKEGSYYAAYLEATWFRVKALSTIIEGFVRVCLIDHGDIDEVSLENLFPLDERFTNLPAQKVSCSLTGLEKYSKDIYVTGMVSELTSGKTLVARVDTRNPCLQLTLLDTSTDVDININEQIEERIEKELEPPKVPSKSNVTDAYLISVKEDGLAYVQIYSESYKLLKSFLDEAYEELALNFDNYKVKSTNELVGSKIFLARYALDGLWYRVVIDEVISEEQIAVSFVDYGNSDVVTLNDVVDTKNFTEALSRMPEQAVRVRLVKPTEELFTENVLQFLMDLTTPKESNEATRFLLKTVKEGAIPDVYLYYRLPDTNKLININYLIGSYFPQFRGPNHVAVNLSTVNGISCSGSNSNSNSVISQPMDVEFGSKPKETLERAFPVLKYAVPRVKEQFSVHVTMVSSPFHFIVQPQADAVKLSKLKSDMKSLYDKETLFVDVSNIKENEIYAVKHHDGMWYRGSVLTMMKAYNNVSIKLIDYGEIITVPHSNIAPLLPDFRSLCRQAIRAELAGVLPLHSDWCVDDSLRFKQLVSEKMLISIVVDVLDDEKLSIILYDTSTDPAIDIGAVLVQEGRAKDITQH